MTDVAWTSSMIEDRFAEAADVMKRLPCPRIQGYFNTWPAMLTEFSDLIGREPDRLRRGPPSPQAISRMEVTLEWLRWLEPTERKVVWLRASGQRWKDVCFQVGLARTAANQRWLYALSVIAFRLNGQRLPARRSRQYAIELARTPR